MSLARIYTTKKVQKNWKCGKCGAAIVKGQDGRISFAVGFRGYEQTRCLKPECRPTRSELESSLVATVYAAQDDIDYDSLDSVEALEEARDSVAEACNEVASEYQNNEMFDINEDLQERAEMLEAAASEIEGWDPDGEEPEDEVDCDTCGGSGQVTDDEVEEDDCEDCDATGTVDNTDAKEEWLQAQRDSLREAIDGLELP